MSRAVTLAVLALLVVGDLAGFVTAQAPPREVDRAVDSALRAAGMNPDTVDRIVAENRSAVNGTREAYLESRLVYQTRFETETGEWAEVRLPGDTSPEPVLWRRLPNSGPDNTSAYVATSPSTGSFPAGIDRALEGPVFDLRYMRAKGGLVANASANASTETYDLVDDFWGPTARRANYGPTAGIAQSPFGGLYNPNGGTSARINENNPVPSSNASLYPSVGDVNLSIVHAFNFSSALTSDGQAFDGSRLEVRLRGENGTWSRWVGLDPTLVKALATATDQDYALGTFLSQGPSARVEGARLSTLPPSGTLSDVPPQQIYTDRETRIITGQGVETPPINPAETVVPGTDLVCAFFDLASVLLRDAQHISGQPETAPATNATRRQLAGCERESGGPLNPSDLVYRADNFNQTRDVYQGEYNGRVVPFKGEYGYVGASTNSTGNLTWVNSTYDLSAFVGYELQVRFRAASQPAPITRGQGWAIDNLTLYGKVWPMDLGVRNVLFPGANEVLSHQHGASVTATIRNYGATRIHNAFARLAIYDMNGTGPANFTAVEPLGTLAPQEERVVTFRPWSRLAPGDYRIEVTVDFPTTTPQSPAAGNPLSGTREALRDMNPDNDGLRVPVYFRAGLVRALTPVRISVDPAQADVGVKRAVELVVENRGNAPENSSAYLEVYTVNATTGKRTADKPLRIPGSRAEMKEMIPYGKNLVSSGSLQNTRTFTWEWTPTARGVFDLQATIVGEGNTKTAAVRAYVRSSTIPYFSESFNDLATLQQQDPDRLRSTQGNWTIDQFPPAGSPHNASGAWVPTLEDTKVFLAIPDLQQGVTVDVPGVGEQNPADPPAGSDKFPVNNPYPSLPSAVRRNCGNDAFARTRCTYDTAFNGLTGAYNLSFRAAFGNGDSLTVGPVSGIPSLNLFRDGISNLEYLYGGRLHYFLANTVTVPPKVLESSSDLSVRLSFWHQSSMNPTPYNSPLSPRVEERAASAKDGSLVASVQNLNVGATATSTDAKVRGYRTVVGNPSVVLNDVRAPLDEVYGRVLAYPGVVVSAAGRDVSAGVPAVPGGEQRVGVYVRYGDNTATLNGLVAKALNLATPPSEQPYVLGYWNSSFNYREANFTIPAEILRKAEANGLSIVFEYAIPPARAHNTRLPACQPDYRQSDYGGCAGGNTPNLGLTPMKERWILDDIALGVYNKAGQRTQLLLADNAEGGEGRPKPASLSQEWTSNGWRLRQWTNPYPALWHVDPDSGYVPPAGGATRARGLAWTNVSTSPEGYDDNVWTVLRTPPIDLSLATKPVLLFKHNYSFAVPDGSATPNYVNTSTVPSAKDVGLTLDGGNVRIRVLDPLTKTWSSPTLLGDERTYRYKLYLHGGEAFVRPGEKPYVWSNLSDTNGDGRPDWIQQRFDLTDYRGKTIQIEWHAFTRASFPDTLVSPVNNTRSGAFICTRGTNTGPCAVGDGWFLDDVQVQEDRFANDVAVIGMASPDQADTFVGPGTTVPVSVQLENVGAYSQKGVRVNVTITRLDVRDANGKFPVVYQADREMPRVDPITFKERALDPDGRVTVGLPAWSVPPVEEARYRIDVRSSLFDTRFALADDNPTNDYLTREVTGRSLRTLEVRNLTLDPPIGDREKRRLFVEVANVGNTVEDFTALGGLQVRYLARPEGATAWTLIGTRTTQALGLKEVWRPTPVTWTPEAETTYDLRAEITFLTNVDGTPRILASITSARVLSTFLKGDAEKLLAPDQLTGQWGIRTGEAYAGNASYGFPATGPLYGNNANDALTVGPVNLYAAESAILSFLHKYDFEEGYDGGLVEWSADGGQSWTRLKPTSSEKPLTTAAPLVTDPSVRTTAFTGQSDGWVRTLYELGLVPEFTKDDTIIDMGPRDIGDLLGRGASIWARNFTELGNGTTWGSPLVGLPRGENATRTLTLPLDLRGLTATEVVVTYRELQRVNTTLAGGLVSRARVDLLGSDGEVLATLLPTVDSSTLNARGWETVRLAIPGGLAAGQVVHLRFHHNITGGTGANALTSRDGWFVDDVRVVALRGEATSPTVIFPANGEYDPVDYLTLAQAGVRGWEANGFRLVAREDSMWRVTAEDIQAGIYYRYLEIPLDLTEFTVDKGYVVGEVRYWDLRNMAPPEGGGVPSFFSVALVECGTTNVKTSLLPRTLSQNDHYRDWTENRLRLDLATFGGQKLCLQWAFEVQAQTGGPHTSAEFGWFIDNVRVTAFRVSGAETRVFPAHGGVDTVEYVSYADAKEKGWSAYQRTRGQGGLSPKQDGLGWTVVNRVNALPWLYDSVGGTLAIPRGASNVDSRLIIPLDLRAAADDVRLHVKGPFRFDQPVPGSPISQGGARIEVSAVAPTGDPEQIPWKELLPYGTIKGDTDKDGLDDYGRWLVTGYTAYGSDRERNSAFGPGGYAIGGTREVTGEDDGIVFNLTEFRGRKVWIALHAITTSRASDFVHWEVSGLKVVSRILDAENVAFRFRALTDANNGASGWRVDNVTLAGFKRAESLNVLFEGLPINGHLSNESFRPVIVVENRGSQPAVAVVNVGFGVVGETDRVTFTGSVPVPAESVVRVTRLDNKDVVFRAEPGTLRAGKQYELVGTVRAAPRSGAVDTSSYKTRASTVETLNSQAIENFWNRTVAPPGGGGTNKMWHLAPSATNGLHEDQLSYTWTRTASSTNQFYLKWQEMRNLPPTTSAGVRLMNLGARFLDANGQVLGQVELNPLSDAYLPWESFNRPVTLSRTVNQEKLTLQFYIVTDARDGKHLSLDMGWFLDNLELRYVPATLGSELEWNQNLNGFANAAAATGWSRRHLADGQEVPLGSAPSRWDLVTKAVANGFTLENNRLTLTGGSEPTDSRFTWRENLAGFPNPLLVLRHAYRGPMYDGNPVGGFRVEVTTADPNTDMNVFESWQVLPPLGQALGECSEPFTTLPPGIYAPLSRAPPPPGAGEHGCVLGGTLGTEETLGETIFDLRSFADKTVWISLHGYLPRGTTDAFWTIESSALRYEQPRATIVGLRAVNATYDAPLVTKVEVTPDAVNATDKTPLKVRATIKNDGSTTRLLTATLRLENFSNRENEAKLVDSFSHVQAALDPGADRLLAPGEHVNLTWTVPRSWPVGVYGATVTAVFRLDQGERNSSRSARFDELAPGETAFYRFGLIASARQLTGDERITAAPSFWWDVDGSQSWQTCGGFPACSPVNSEYRTYPKDFTDPDPDFQRSLYLHATQQSVAGTYNVSTSTLLDLRSMESAYVSFVHRYYFGEAQEIPADRNEYLQKVTRGQSGGWVEACLTPSMMGFNGWTCGPNVFVNGKQVGGWKKIQPVGLDGAGRLVNVPYPGHVVSIGAQPMDESAGSQGRDNENYNFLAASSEKHYIPEAGASRMMYVADAYSGQSPGYALDGSNPDGWVREVLNLSEFAGQETLLRFRAGLDGSRREVAWVVDALSISPSMPTLTPSQSLLLPDGVQKGFRFTLRNDGSVTDTFVVTANRTAIPATWGFSLPGENGEEGREVKGLPTRYVTLSPGESTEVVLAMDIPIARAFESDRRALLAAASVAEPLKGTDVDFTLRFKPRIWPDLAVEAIKLGTDTPMAENILPVSVRIRNNGDIPAEGVVVRLVDVYLPDPSDPDTAITEVVPALDTEGDGSFRLGPFGAAREVTFNWRPRFAGAHALVAIVDPDMKVVEYTVANNILRKNLNVIPFKESDLRVDLRLVKENGDRVDGEVIQGETVTALLVIENRGSADAQAVLASISVSAPGGSVFPLLPRDPFPVEGVIPAGERRTVRTTWLADVPERYTVLASALVGGGTIPERKGPLPSGTGNYTDDNYVAVPVLVRSTGLKASLGQVEAKLAPGQNVRLPFTLVNGGNGDDAILLDVEVPDGFSALPLRAGAGIPEVTLATKETLQGELSITAPPDAVAGVTPVKLLARSERTGETVTRTATIVVSEKHGLRAEARPLVGAPGDLVAEIQLENRGNVEERLRATPVRDGLERARDLTPLAEGAGEIKLAPYGSGLLKVPFNVPPGVAAGPYDLRLRITNADGTVDQTVTVRVRLTDRAAVSLRPDVAGANLATGDTLKTALVVSNIGNLQARVRVVAEETPALLTVEVPFEALDLDVGSATQVPVQVTASPNLAPGSYDVLLAAVAENGEALGQYRWTFKITGVDFVLTELVYTPRAGFTPGTDLRLTVTVENRGGLPAKAVPVAFYVDGHLVNYTTIPTMQPFENTTVDFRWTVLEGAHVLWVSVDPHQALAESDRANNNRVVEVDGGKAEEGVFGGSMVPGVGLVPALAALAVLAALVGATRRGKEGRKP
ncbi:MAG TPA: CARDB domain-containing protein [Candidatus Thermoplasmatota archaeon]|nr:CARDB domain-containing protein [Candidatus Thermoplasmatota archaeon]